MADTKGIEEILETWAATAQEVMADASELSTNIDDAAHFAEASLSYLRTRLLRMELAAMIVSLALTFGAMVGGIFGMNLKSGLEEKDGMFVGVVASMIGVCVIIMLGLGYLYIRGKRHYRANCARYGNNLFFHHIEDDAYVLRSVDAGLEGIFQDLRTPAQLQPGAAARRPSNLLSSPPNRSWPAAAGEVAGSPPGRVAVSPPGSPGLTRPGWRRQASFSSSTAAAAEQFSPNRHGGRERELQGPLLG